VKEVDQQGLLVERKNYVQTLTFDSPNKRIVAEKSGTKEKQEFALSSETFDPFPCLLNIILKEELHPGRASIPPFSMGQDAPDGLLFKEGKSKIKMLER